VRINEELLERKSSGSDKNTEINGRGGPPRSQSDTAIATKVGIKIRLPASVA
jgi:hypothetical protein